MGDGGNGDGDGDGDGDVTGMDGDEEPPFFILLEHYSIHPTASATADAQPNFLLEASPFVPVSLILPNPPAP
ncbi:hypothetical protein BO71DRAFT_432631 [Aspergillus ellipticus CBS 707.79]|uniref:Uncharacterized protein n=1 Tax=Aspergillus ellipticus CBS 707.79 TaxID=1448320 RepID=A0A319D3I7_9EURO|nr:hypothetical protein BO71DRAFT_432631 [Aspergillus ellipticus CBS 707.79]